VLALETVERPRPVVATWVDARRNATTLASRVVIVVVIVAESVPRIIFVVTVVIVVIVGVAVKIGRAVRNIPARIACSSPRARCADYPNGY
jgi:predicted benzoate:H+ symporter BenE